MNSPRISTIARSLLSSEQLNAVLAVAVSFAVLMTSILSFRTRWGTAVYNATVAHKVLFWLAVLTPVALMLGRRAYRPRPEALVAFGLLASAFTIAALISPASEVSFLRLSMYYAFVAFGLVLSCTLGKPSRSAIAALLLAISIVHAAFLTIALNAAISHDPNAPFAPPYFGNVRHLGYLGFVGAAASLAFLILDRRLRAAGLFLTVYALFGVVALGSRGALVSWLISFVLLAVLCGQRRRVIGSAAGCLAAAIALAYLAHSADVFHAPGMFDRAVLTEGIVTTSVGRPAVWIESWQRILEQPLLGYGPEGFAIAGVTKGFFAQPHNFVLQILLESGVIGLLATIAFCWVLFAKRLKAVALSRRDRSLGDEEAGLVATLAGFFAFGLIDGVFYHAIPLLCFVILVAAWFGLRSHAEES